MLADKTTKGGQGGLLAGNPDNVLLVDRTLHEWRKKYTSLDGNYMVDNFIK